jgi:hypothetical protein
VSLPACAACRYIYTRPVDELQAEAMRLLKEVGSPDGAQFWGCNHREAVILRDGFVACAEMRLIGRPCGRDGVLWEARDDDGGADG